MAVNVENSTDYTRKMLTSLVQNKCVPRTCEPLKTTGMDLTSKEFSKRCIVDPICIADNALDYATTDIMERMSESEEVPPGTDILLTDNMQMVRSKMAAKFAPTCGVRLDTKISQPVDLMYDFEGKIDTTRFGNKETNCFLKKLSDTVISTPIQKKENFLEKNSGTLIAIGLITLVWFVRKNYN